MCVIVSVPMPGGNRWIEIIPAGHRLHMAIHEDDIIGFITRMRGRKLRSGGCGTGAKKCNPLSPLAPRV